MGKSTGDSVEGEYIFEHISAPVESVQSYVPGGLHPVHLGDKVGRYNILRKLGYGGYSTVWLAEEDCKSGAYVALKIVRADTDCAQEVQHYNKLHSDSSQCPGQSHIMMLKDYFTIDGPNGMHDCLAYEVLGPSIARVLADSAGADTTAYLTLPSARKIIYQVLLGLDYMHSVGLVHGDIYSSNVLFTVGDLSHEPLDVVYQPQSQVSDEVKRLKGSREPGDPRHLTLDWPLNHYLSIKGNVKLIDLGNSFSIHDPPTKLDTPLEYRSPELLISNQISKAQDCWALACFVYEILTNTSLFDLAFLYSKDSQTDAHMLQLFSLLGPLPTKARHSWSRYNIYFNDSDQLQKFVVDDLDALSAADFEDLPNDDDDAQDVLKNTEVPGNEHQSIGVLPDIPSHPLGRPQEFFNPHLYPSIIALRERKPHRVQDDPESLADFVAVYPSFSDRWKAEKHPDMKPAEANVVFDFLQSLLTYDADQRPSIKELLQHPWIQKYCAPNNETDNLMQGSAPSLTSFGNKRKRSAADGQSESSEVEVNGNKQSH